jgi:hypothetical protein
VSPRSASLAVLLCGASGCIDVLETPHFQSRDASAQLDVSVIDGASDSGSLDGMHADRVATDGAGDAVQAVEAGGTDGQAFDGGLVEAGRLDVVHSDGVTPDIISATDGETTLEAGPAIFVGPAGGSCATADFHPDANFSGTTCGGTDAIALACNPGAHPEVVIRIDAMTGDVFTLTLSAGLSFATFLGTACDRAPLTCGGMTTGAGSITLGPYPSARVDYIVIESAASSGCGPYTATLRRL